MIHTFTKRRSLSRVWIIVLSLASASAVFLLSGGNLPDAHFTVRTISNRASLQNGLPPLLKRRDMDAAGRDIADAAGENGHHRLSGTRVQRNKPSVGQYSNETELAKVSQVWGEDGAAYAWPRSVRIYSQCRHPGEVRICSKPRKQFVILLWDEEFWNTRSALPFVIHPPKDGLLHFGCCDGMDMVYTADKAMLSTADIVDFHPKYRQPMPMRGHKHQAFMMSSGEPPYVAAKYSVPMEEINLLRTFSRSSDIAQSLTHPGECFCEKFLQPLKVPYRERQRVPVSVLVSNCKSYGGRSQLLQYLMSKVEVHSMGRCFHNHAMPPGQDTDTVLEKYLFNFAAENAVCVDYITEKFHRALKVGTVPIVLSQDHMPGYEFVAPTEDSYVDLSRYASIDEAAEFIRMTSSSEEAYHRHHTYRGKMANSTVLSHTFRTKLCAEKEDDLGEWCDIASRMETPKGREQVLQKTYFNYRDTIARQCASRDSMARNVPSMGIGLLHCAVVALLGLGIMLHQYRTSIRGKIRGYLREIGLYLVRTYTPK
ncbi:alpha-(1,3)-fucosyltransferase 11-like [Sycon ciliatum]|uniref:alpha-(1,3)-fucosyltransferase 11-like n=1 Tax=Sycon ciliatum TaxID=27933 RepID=UPI0020A8F4AB|eukprot:scpid4993/ scgid33678/ Alpha-(1,3)-fucosyltransferase 11; Fucosyltransferase XI; Galactoside 3-L-fucosyltransferase 11